MTTFPVPAIESIIPMGSADREAVYRVLKVFMDTMHAMKAGPYAERCAERPWGPLPDPRAGHPDRAV